MLWHHLIKDRRGVVALIFALIAIPLVGLVGLAVDYAMVNQTRAALTLAADGAALNAAKVAATAEQRNDANYVAEGQAAGTAWFNAQLGRNVYGLTNLTPTVVVTPGDVITATVTYTGTVSSVFGKIFNVATYPMNVQSAATITAANYLEVQILLDNSSSMQIAATQSDIDKMLALTPCSVVSQIPPGAESSPYSGFMNTYGGSPYQYTGTWPVPYANSSGGISTLPAPAAFGPSCQNFAKNSGQVNGGWPTAGVPCAFACHSDNTKPAGSGNDLFAVARSTRGTGAANEITLRFDVVKAAVNTVLTSMAANTTAVSNLSVGIWDFNSTLNRDYPPSGEAGTDFTAAQAAVGGPPSYPNGPDTGIQPDAAVSGATPADTFFYATATQLAGILTPAGNGLSASSPKKVLFLVTDGLSDVTANGGTAGPFDTTRCDLFKTLGYTIYVVYTPYYSFPHIAYWAANGGNIPFYTQSTNAGSDAYALQQCASAPSDYIAASDQTSLTNALNKFLQSAISSPAHYSK